MERWQGAMHNVEPWQNDEHSKGRQRQSSASGVDPLADSEARIVRNKSMTKYGCADEHDESWIAREPLAAWSQHVAKILSDLNPGFRRVQDRKQPEIPRHEKTGQCAKRQLRPLIQTAFERHLAS
jgi:hypothetical protein